MTVVLFHSLHQVFSRNVDLLCQLLKGICLVSAACSHQIAHLLVEVVHFVPCGVSIAVHNNVHGSICLIKQSQGHLIPASAFVDKPVALFIYKDTALHGMLDVAGKASGLRIAQRKHLDIAHLHQIRANGLCHKDAVAGNGRCVGRRDGIIQSRP